MQAARITSNHIPVPSFLFLNIPIPISMSVSISVSIPTVEFLLLFPVHPVSDQADLFVLMLVLGHIHHVLTHLIVGWLLIIVPIGLVLVSLLGGLNHGELVTLLGHAGEGFIAGRSCEHHFVVLMMGRREVAHSVAETRETLHLVIVYHNVEVVTRTDILEVKVIIRTIIVVVSVY